MNARITRLGDGIALQDADGREVVSLRFSGEGGVVRLRIEGDVPEEIIAHPDDIAHFSLVANESAVNAVWPGSLVDRRADEPRVPRRTNPLPATTSPWR